MENRSMKLNTFNLIIGVLGGIVTIIASVGGSYVTTQVVLARHDERIRANSNKIENLQIEDKEINEKVDKQLEILMKIDKTIAVIEERTKK
jgi:uncharacterized membrane protein (DUF106 family)